MFRGFCGGMHRKSIIGTLCCCFQQLLLIIIKIYYPDMKKFGQLFLKKALSIFSHSIIIVCAKLNSSITSRFDMDAVFTRFGLRHFKRAIAGNEGCGKCLLLYSRWRVKHSFIGVFIPGRLSREAVRLDKV